LASGKNLPNLNHAIILRFTVKHTILQMKKKNYKKLAKLKHHQFVQIVKIANLIRRHHFPIYSTTDQREAETVGGT
jgi:hypothetical protein